MARVDQVLGVATDITLQKQAAIEMQKAEGSGRGGDRGQERVPGEHEPRDPHADERRARA